MKRTLAFLSVFIQFNLFAAFSPNPILSSFWVSPPSESVMEEVARNFEVVRKSAGGYEVLVPLSETNRLFDLVPSAKLLNLDISAEAKQKSRSELTGYHDFASVQTHLQSIKNNYPELASLEQYGNSKEGRPLLALKLTSSQKGTGKPAILLTSSTHGDELTTVEVVLGLLDQLVEGYGKEARLTQMVDSHEIYFIPVVNPDGYVRKERYANGIDPNRDYPWPGKPNHQSNPCISSLIKFYESHQIKGSIDFHSTGEMIMYPWAYTYDSLPSFEENTFDRMTTQMASFNGYVHGQISKVIYKAQGSSADFYHWKYGAWALGIEIGTQKIPSASQIPGLIKDNTESTWAFVEAIQ